MSEQGTQKLIRLALISRIRELEKTLEFYADEEIYSDGTAVDDGGLLARETLRNLEDTQNESEQRH